MNQDSTTTIAAVSTPAGEGGIGIVRLSGPKAIAIVDRIFKAANRQKISAFQSSTTHLGKIFERSEIVDEVLVGVFRAPHSYTREDVVEINAHGGLAAVQKILILCLNSGARLAEPGEFTKRAFLNGRIDLTQAEAVADLIQAKTEQFLKVAASQLTGGLSKKIKLIRDKIVGLLAAIEVNLDYSEEDLPVLSAENIQAQIKLAGQEIEKLLHTAFRGKILRQGLRIGILGKPNVGKSSLLNILIEEEKAIVTNIPGTTRDILEGEINLKGVPVLFYDTAGIRVPKDEIEKLGIERSKNKIEHSDLILFVLDGSLPLAEEDNLIAKELQGKKKFVLINKTDLPAAFSEKDVSSLFPEEQSAVLHVSVVQGKGIENLKNSIYDLFLAGEISQPELIVTNLRHEQALRQAKERLLSAQEGMKQRLSLEFIAADLAQSLNFLGEIIGETVTEDILKEIFSRFCVGK
ncbi:MAG: tRNA uridine-5-carboxymethylaminomethyl(34) synthesis GTPase MnmE [Elusimicrobiota bacterium]